MRHSEIEANGISLHFVGQGEGPAVLFATASRRSGHVGRLKWKQ
jgi:hypothetical protein